MYMSTHTNTHTAEVAHDKALLDLLWTQVTADHKVDQVFTWLKDAVVAYRQDWRGGDRYESNDGGPRSFVTYDEMPVGTLYTVRERNARGHGSSDVVKVRGDHSEAVVAAGEYKVGPYRDARATRDDVLNAAAIIFLSERPEGYYEGQHLDRVVRLSNELEAAEVAAQAAVEAVRVHELDYTGWSRFWLVTTSSGHVHSSTACSTCYATTGFAPYPDLSGCDEVEAVAILGETLCSVCFPSAPVEYTTGKKITKAAVKKLTGRTWEA